jgi:hypothetical protein
MQPILGSAVWGGVRGLQEPGGNEPNLTSLCAQGAFSLLRDSLQALENQISVALYHLSKTITRYYKLKLKDICY